MLRSLSKMPVYIIETVRIFLSELCRFKKLEECLFLLHACACMSKITHAHKKGGESCHVHFSSMLLVQNVVRMCEPCVCVCMHANRQ